MTRVVGIIRHQKSPDSGRDGSDEYFDEEIATFDNIECARPLMDALSKLKDFYGIWFVVTEYNKGHNYNSIGGDPKNLATIEKGKII